LAARGVSRRLTARDTNGKPSILLASAVCHPCCSKNMIRDRTHARELATACHQI
jgi:hypothetical protein